MLVTKNFGWKFWIRPHQIDGENEFDLYQGFKLNDETDTAVLRVDSKNTAQISSFKTHFQVERGRFLSDVENK